MTGAEIVAWGRGARPGPGGARATRARVVIGDAGIYLARGGGELERIEPGGHARPGGWSGERAPSAARRPS